MVDENLVTHFICQGGCGGVAPAEGTCQLPTCSKFNQSLMPCVCTDGLHGMAPKKVEDEIAPMVEQSAVEPSVKAEEVL